MTSAASGTNCDALYKCYFSKTELANQAATTGFIAATPSGKGCANGEICPAGTAVAALCPPGKYMKTIGGTSP